MEAGLQQSLDALAARVGRPVVFEDSSAKLIGFSAHDQPSDAVRENSILRRHAAPSVRSWLGEFGLSGIRQPVRTPANPGLGMLPRLCVPVLYDDELLGHLWFIDPHSAMTAADVETCVHESVTLATYLHHEQMSGLFSRARVTEAIQALLSESPMSSAAARSLTDDGHFARDGVVAIVLQGYTDDEAAEAGVDDALAKAATRIRRLLHRGQVIDLVSRDHCVFLLSASGEDDPRLRERVGTVARTVRGFLEPEARAGALVSGVGSYQPSLEQVHQSYSQARMCADAALSLPGLGDVTYWSELGVDQTVVRLAALGDDLPVHAGLGRLLDDPDALPLLETLETYLDVAGNVQLTAERLHLHRTSLYYRLQRLEQRAHTDLKSGIERLTLHLALRVARMTGQYVPRHHDGPVAHQRSG